MIKKQKARTAQKNRLWTLIKQSASIQLFGQEPKNPELFLLIYSQAHLCDLIGSYLCRCDQSNLAQVLPFSPSQHRPCINPNSCCKLAKQGTKTRIKCSYCRTIHIVCPQMYSVDLTTPQLIPVDAQPFEVMKRVTDCYPSMRQMYSNRLPNGKFFVKYLPQRSALHLEYREVDLCEAQQTQALHFLIGPLQAWLYLAESQLK